MSKRSVPVNGPVLKQCRVEKAWPQERLADLAKVDPKTVIKAEAGGRIDLDTIRRLADALGVDPTILMSRMLSGATGDFAVVPIATSGFQRFIGRNVSIESQYLCRGFYGRLESVVDQGDKMLLYIVGDDGEECFVSSDVIDQFIPR